MMDSFCKTSRLTVLATPGHTPGGLCFYHEEVSSCLPGDTLFAGSIGRTDLQGGSYSLIMKAANGC
jgi:glyoxylase-like metal-dependent hydrolase (beta-lactamase superfamily II)